MFTLLRATDAEFDAYARKQPSGNFHQTAHMANFRRALGWDVHPLVLKKDSEIVGALLLAGKSNRYEVTMGPVVHFSKTATVNELLKQTINYVKSIGGHTLELYPYSVYQTRSANGTVETGPFTACLDTFKKNGWKHKGFTANYDAVANRWVFVKDLSTLKNEADLLASYRQTTRQTVKKLIQADYSIKKLSYNELEVAKKLIDSSYDRNEVHKRDLNYYQQLFTHFGDDIEFLVVYHKGTTPISTGVFIKHPNELVYFASGADTKYRHLYGGHFLQHYVMNQAIKEGIKRYNFYGVSGHFEKNPLLVYKSGFRGHIEEYVGGFTYITNPGKHLVRRALRAPKAAARKILGK